VRVPVDYEEHDDGSERTEDEATKAVEADEVQSPEDDEQARVEAAIRAGEEAAEADLKADAERIEHERDDLQKQVGDLEEAVKAAEQKAADAMDRLTRLQADWENFRRRTSKERLAERERATEKLVGNILPVIDDLERAIEHGNTTGEGNEALLQFVAGVDATREKLVDVLQKEGATMIDPAGEAFDPLSHQAVGRVEDAEAYVDTVAEVYQKGCSMGGKVIRPAMVTVTFGGPKRPAEGADDDETPPEAQAADDEAEA